MLADHGYDARAILDLVGSARGGAHLPPCSDQKVQRFLDPALSKQCNLVRPFLCKLKHFRQIATRFDKLARDFVATELPVSTRL